MTQIEAPTHCPSCNSELETVNFILYCRSAACPAQGLKLIENFGKVLKIIGLGPAAIRKLNISSIQELYELDVDDITDILGEALGNKLYANIEKSNNASLNQVLPAMGIPLIGKTASDKICANINHISEITEELANSVLGPKAAANLLSWLDSEEWQDLPFSFVAEKKNTTGDTVCITGKLKSFKTKAEAHVYLSEKGYTPVESVTKTTKYLVNESGVESAKTEKARANGTIIVNNIKELI
jgi:NAD-dependent DNA ligase